MIWTKIKLWAAAIGAALLVALSVAVKFFAGKWKTEKRRRKRVEKNLEHAAEVIEKDNVIDVEFRSRRADVANELKEGRSPTVFTDPNSMFDDPKDD